MSHRALLSTALALIAGGLLLGGIGLVTGDGAAPLENQQPFSPNGQHGPRGGFRPGPPGSYPELGPGQLPRRGVPLPAASPKPAPQVTPTP